MRHRLTAVTAAVLAGVALPLALGDASSTRGDAVASGVPVARPVPRDRIFLTAGQVRQTRDPAAWPTEVKSLLNVGTALHHGEWVWDDRGVAAGRTAVRVDLGTQLISVTRGGHEIGAAVILYGAEDHATPLGRLPVLSKAARYRSHNYDAPMPYTLRLTSDGVALHGSDVRAGHATHGCVGLPLAFARKLFDEIAVGDEVLIVRTEPARPA